MFSNCCEMDDTPSASREGDQYTSSTGRLVLTFRSERIQRPETPAQCQGLFEVSPVSPTSSYREGSEIASFDVSSIVSIVEYYDKEAQCDFETHEKMEKKRTSRDDSLPTGPRLVILLVCTCMAIFLQALVCNSTCSP